MSFLVKRCPDGPYLNIATGTWVSEDQLEAGYDGSDERTARRTTSRKNRRRNSSSEEELPKPSMPIATDKEPSADDPAAHISYFDLLSTLHTHESVGPGNALGLPVGVYTGDPFDFKEDMTVYDRLLFHRVVFINLISTGSPRWNVVDVNINGDEPINLKRERPKAAKCAPKQHTSFFKEHSCLRTWKEKGDLVKMHIFRWMRALWNMGHSSNWPSMRLFIESPHRTDEREDRYRRMTKNDYQLPLFRDDDFEGDPIEGRYAVAQLMLSALNCYRLISFGDYGSTRDTPIDDHRLQEFMWNFSWHADMICAVRDKILTDHANTLFSTRKAQVLQRHSTTARLEALERLVSPRIMDMGKPPAELQLAGGPTIFGRFPQRKGDTKEQVEDPENTLVRTARRPGGFDMDEAEVFQKLGEFTLRKRMHFGCDEIVHDDPSNPGSQKGRILSAEEMAEKRQRHLDRKILRETRKSTEQGEGIEHGVHPNALSWWFADPDDLRAKPPTPPRRRQPSEKSPSKRDKSGSERMSPTEASLLLFVKQQEARIRMDKQHEAYVRQEERTNITSQPGMGSPIILPPMPRTPSPGEVTHESPTETPCPSGTGPPEAVANQPGSSSSNKRGSEDEALPTQSTKNRKRAGRPRGGSNAQGKIRQTENSISPIASTGPELSTAEVSDLYEPTPGITRRTVPSPISSVRTRASSILSDKILKNPVPIKKSNHFRQNPESDLEDAKRRAFNLDYYDLFFRFDQSQGPRASRYSPSEKQALREEFSRRRETGEGYGQERTERTSDMVKEEEAVSMARDMSNEDLLLHLDYMENGSGAYNPFQTKAIREEINLRFEEDGDDWW